MGHYDARYFHNVVSYEERTDTLTHMIRAYLNFFREYGLETWIAHGTLLGWWWNGKVRRKPNAHTAESPTSKLTSDCKMLPWDWDVDTQVSGETLAHLSDRFNQTICHYVSDDRQVMREYLLDVNPFGRERGRGEGLNIIDARWIDRRNGLYIDITALSELHPDTEPGVWSCKNFHKYKTKDLYPMRESLYEGVPAKIPFKYLEVLVEEYGQNSFVVTEFQE
jgi:hypothetical protein